MTLKSTDTAEEIRYEKVEAPEADMWKIVRVMTEGPQQTYEFVAYANTETLADLFISALNTAIGGPTKVLIVVEGGVVQCVLSNSPVVQVHIKDFDNIKAGDKFDPDGFHEPDAVYIEEADFQAACIVDVEEDQLYKPGDEDNSDAG